MKSQEFVQVRRYLGKTQNQMARLLNVSLKSVQSFEQGWRNIPVSVERQLMFFLFLKRGSYGATRPCWDVTGCPDEWKKECPAWELKAGNFCWFINGTFCKGQLQDNWKKKTATCRQCEVFWSMIPSLV